MKRTHYCPLDLARVRVETRAASDGSQRQVIVGYASVFNAWTELYRGRSLVIRERVLPGAFRNALAEGQDVKALFNHDQNIVLGCNLAGTLMLSEDATGLQNEIEFPDTQTVRDLVLVPMARKDISGQSFAFLPRAGGYRFSEYEQDGLTFVDYELSDADLFDVSVVTYPQYKEASASLRSAGSRDEVLRALDLDQVEAVRAEADPAATPEPEIRSEPEPEPDPAPATSAGSDPVRRAARERALFLAGL